MILKKIKNSVILVVVFFSWVGVVNAGLEITEIMYAPENGTDYEWVEIYNNGTDSEDLNKYIFFRGEKFSSFALKSGSTTILQHNEYAIIAKSLSNGYNWLNFSGPIFSASTLSLPDNSEKYDTYIKILDPTKNDVDSIRYDTSKGGSKVSKTSLSKIDGEWTSATPTPGTANSSNTNSSDNSSEDNNVDENVDYISVIEDIPEILKITTKIISPKMVTAGIPFSLNSLTTTNRKETYAVGKFVWNFGDGMMKETGQANPFEYMYEYPGDYALTLSYYNSVFSTNPDAIDKITIKAVPSEIYISSVGNFSDPFIELENKSNYEIILSNWVITGGIHYFIIPEGTTLLPNKKIKLSPKITRFTGDDIKSVIITNPNKEITATYPTETKKPIQKNTSVKTTYTTQDDSLLKDPQVINLNDLGADAGGANVNISNSTYAWAGLLVIIGLGVASFMVIKKRKNYDDYVEKEIRAEDMTIVE